MHLLPYAYDSLGFALVPAVDPHAGICLKSLKPCLICQEPEGHAARPLSDVDSRESSSLSGSNTLPSSQRSVAGSSIEEGRRKGGQQPTLDL